MARAGGYASAELPPETDSAITILVTAHPSDCASTKMAGATNPAITNMVTAEGCASAEMVRGGDYASAKLVTAEGCASAEMVTAEGCAGEHLEPATNSAITNMVTEPRILFLLKQKKKDKRKKKKERTVLNANERGDGIFLDGRKRKKTEAAALTGPVKAEKPDENVPPAPPPPAAAITGPIQAEKPDENVPPAPPPPAAAITGPVQAEKPDENVPPAPPATAPPPAPWYHPDNPPLSFMAGYCEVMLIRYKNTWLAAWEHTLEKVIRYYAKNWHKFLVDLQRHRANELANVPYADGLKTAALDALEPEPKVDPILCEGCGNQTTRPKKVMNYRGKRVTDSCADCCPAEPPTPLKDLVGKQLQDKVAMQVGR